MMNFKKKDVVDMMRTIGIEDRDITKKDCEQFLDLSLEAIIETLAKGTTEPPDNSNVRASLRIVGFGTFDVVVTSPRKVLNPKKPDERFINPPHNRIRFRSGKLLNERTEHILVAQ